MDLTLTDEEASVLRQVLEGRLSELNVEVRHSVVPAYRGELKARRSLLHYTGSGSDCRLLRPLSRLAPARAKARRSNRAVFVKPLGGVPDWARGLVRRAPGSCWWWRWAGWAAPSVRFLGTFLPGPADVPWAVAAHLAAQLDIADPGVLKQYATRDGTNRLHAGEIQRVDLGEDAGGSVERRLGACEANPRRLCCPRRTSTSSRATVSRWKYRSSCPWSGSSAYRP